MAGVTTKALLQTAARQHPVKNFAAVNDLFMMFLDRYRTINNLFLNSYADSTEVFSMAICSTKLPALRKTVLIGYRGEGRWWISDDVSSDCAFLARIERESNFSIGVKKDTRPRSR
jgi:hypothetical protein